MTPAILNLTITILNLALSLGIIYFLLHYLRIAGQSPDLEPAREDPRIEDVLQRLAKIEDYLHSLDFSGGRPESHSNENRNRNRIKSAVISLQNGEDPEEVGREYGYSRSEMGILLATAGLYSEKHDNLSPSVN